MQWRAIGDKNMVKSLKGGKRKQFQERDAGIYECQIPTQPPQSYPINLNIIGCILYFIFYFLYFIFLYFIF